MNVSDESHEGWSRFAAQHGMSLAVLLEVLGRHLDEALTGETLERIAVEGRELTAQRRKAGGPKPKRKTRKG